METSPALVLTTADALRAIVAEEVARIVPALARRLDARRPAPRADTLAPMMTAKEVAAVLRVDPRELRRMVRGGLFPAPVRVGVRGIRWLRSDVETATHGPAGDAR